MLLFYVRHGDPIYSPDQLTPFGKRQAEAVGKRLALYGIDKIYASTSNRAVETAIPASEMTGKEIIQLDFCNEIHAVKEFAVTNPNGTRAWAFYDTETKKLFALNSVAYNEEWYNDPRFKPNDFKKGVERINRETDEFLLSLGYEHDRQNHVYKPINPTNERVALFAHQGFGIAFLSSLLDVSYPIYSNHFDMSHSSMTVIEFKEEEGIVIPKVLTLSNDGHLYREGLSTKHNGGETF